jgi:ubiquitin C-terminal hydrolase
MQRKKLHNRVEFPLVLDMRPYLNTATLPSELPPLTGLHGGPRLADVQGQPHIYELFSVLIHRGSSNAGHYYAYIRVRCACLAM